MASAGLLYTCLCTILLDDYSLVIMMPIATSMSFSFQTSHDSKVAAADNNQELP